MIQAVIFDIGGVLAYDVWEHLLLDPDMGIASLYHLNYAQTEQVGLALWNKYSALPGDTQRGWRQLEDDYWTDFVTQMGLNLLPAELVQHTDRFIRPIAGMHALLTRLESKGINMGICSDNTEFWFERQMNGLGLRHFFDPEKIALSCRIGHPKSSSGQEMFRSVTQALGLDKSDCVFVDDRGESAGPAVAFGLPTILFPSHAVYGAQYLAMLLSHVGLW